MGKTLIIAEKPSVAGDIAKALGKFQKPSTHIYENDAMIISSAVGHLLELTIPEEYEVKRGKWSFNNLPMIPPHFALKEIEKAKARLQLLVKLIKRKDVSLLVNACDAGREGELIFQFILQYSGVKKPVKRLWLQSMTAKTIREGFEKLRPGESMLHLADAARCRAEADWLVGINGTRAMTAFNSQQGGFQLTPTGRVQTPTLAILVEREKVINQFVTETYYQLNAIFEVTEGEFSARWLDRNKIQKDKISPTQATRIWNKETAQEILRECQGQVAAVSDEVKPSKQLPSLLYDLTVLQKEANKRFGLSAKSTLSIAQSLYEKHKVITYPRTDAKYLPEDYPEVVQDMLEEIARNKDYDILAPYYSSCAHTIIKNNSVNSQNKRIFDQQKISDHFAIIPTNTPPKTLNELEIKIYDLIMRRFLAAFFPPAHYSITTRQCQIQQHIFQCEGKVLTQIGWREVYGKEILEDDHNALAALNDNETHVKNKNIDLLEQQTKAPPRYTEATLLSAMESAGKLVEDEELREAMSTKGLGTPATRAAIIEGLVSEEYVMRQNKDLMPTAKAFSLITLLHGLSISELTSAELTGEWEYKLGLIEKGQLPREQFMEKIRTMTRRIVEQAKNFASDTVPGDFSELCVPCPSCQSQVKENYRSYQCTQCPFYLRKNVSGRLLEVKEAEELITERKIGPLTGFRSKKGQLFSTILKLNAENIIEFDFGSSTQELPLDWETQQAIGKCPKCCADVLETDSNYACKNCFVKEPVDNKTTCSFKVSKIILQCPISREQMVKMLTEGKTDLLKSFISKKGRPFSAFLLVEDTGNLVFQFQEKTSITTVADKKGVVESVVPSKSEKSKDIEGVSVPKKGKITKKSALVKGTKITKKSITVLKKNKETNVLEKGQLCKTGATKPSKVIKKKKDK